MTATLRRAFAWHRPLMTLAATMAVLSVACFVGLFADGRTLTGLPIWDKPLKFALSTLIYAVTWAWLISLVREHRPRRSARWASGAGTLAAVLLAVELAVIVWQAARGETSHFNQTTPLNSGLYRAMAVSIVAVWLATLAVAVQLFRVRDLDPARRLALRAGATLALVGMALGFLMTSPTSQQLESDSDIVGAHTVGLSDGGPGLPFLGWSTVGGDLRIPHFVGMHALQAIPLVLIALELLAPRVPVLHDAVVRRRLVATAAGAYAAMLALLTWQALRGQSIVAPDALTLVAGTAIVVATAVAAVLAVRIPRCTVTEPEPEALSLV